jgi:hypothetical protein
MNHSPQKKTPSRVFPREGENRNENRSLAGRLLFTLLMALFLFLAELGVVLPVHRVVRVLPWLLLILILLFVLRTSVVT